MVEVTNPLGNFYLNEESEKPLVLLSGGIGVTPVMSMRYKAAEQGRKILFVQAVLNSSAHTFKEEVEKITDQYKNVQTAIFYQTPLEEDKINKDYDNVGFISEEWIRENLSIDAEFYFCGPLGFMKHIEKTLKSIGVKEEFINYELFA
ncbi:MAG: hypothetical protein RR620_14205 [Clostridium sp.]